MQMAGDIRIQKARARWQRVHQSINAGYGPGYVFIVFISVGVATTPALECVRRLTGNMYFTKTSFCLGVYLLCVFVCILTCIYYSNYVF